MTAVAVDKTWTRLTNMEGLTAGVHTDVLHLELWQFESLVHLDGRVLVPGQLQLPRGLGDWGGRGDTVRDQ